MNERVVKDKWIIDGLILRLIASIRFHISRMSEISMNICRTVGTAYVQVYKEWKGYIKWKDVCSTRMIRGDLRIMRIELHE